MKYDLNRFIKAQEEDYARALKEIKNGKKVSHWMWYIFPQIKGLGRSSTAIYYAIKSRKEAREYLNNDYLRNNLFEITEALLALPSRNASEIFGDTDDKKLKSCMTLFYYTMPNEIFYRVIQEFYHGEFDQKTIKLMQEEL